MFGNDIMLEPRLQMYLDEKKHHKNNPGYTPDISLEKKYSITREDIRRLKAYKSGRKDIYDADANNDFYDSIEPGKSNFTEPLEIYKSDIRYKNYMTRIKRDKDAQSQRYNYDEFPEYQDDRISPTMSKDVVNKVFTQSGRIYNNHPPTIERNVRIYPMKNNKPQKEPIRHNQQIDRVISNLDSYVSKVNETYRFKSDMDNETKSVIPNIASSGKKALNTSNYKSMPYLGNGNGMKDISIETKLKHNINDKIRKYSNDKTLEQTYDEQNSGYPTRGAKSYGYNNPIEHYYDYIDDAIQNPDNLVDERGACTRLNNHSKNSKT